MAKVAIFLATGFEETEMIATVDVLRRAQSTFPGSFSEVEMVSVTKNKQVVGAHNIAIQADKTLEEISFANYDCLVLPGGQPGVDNLMKCTELMDALEKHGKANKAIAAICAAPQILGRLGLVDGIEVTHYPGCDKYLEKADKKPHMSTISDKNIITGSSIGGALLFALQIVDYFTSTEQMLELHKQLVFNY